MFPLVFLLLVTHSLGVGAQIHISVTTFGPPAAPGAPNTFIATGSQLGSSFLASDTPALLWGVISSNDVNAVCQHIVNTGHMNFSTTVHVATPSNSGQHTDTETVDLQVTDMEGCLAASDGSGTEAVITASNGRQAALLCPEDAGAKGCGVYYLGDDINTLYFQGSRGVFSNTTSRIRKLLSCESGAETGAIIGGASSVFGMSKCMALGPLAPLCVAGWAAFSAGVGATGGCASSSIGGGCFPGEATVLLANGEFKSMAGLALGDKVAVRTMDGGVVYEDVYAFGHKDASASGHYIQLIVQPIAKGVNISDPAFKSELESRTLELTPLHFAHIYSGPEGKILYKRAKDINVGDMMLGQTSDAEGVNVTTPYQVTDVSLVVKQGLYNPFTLSGAIIVNGVAASTHSDWFLDSTFDFLGLTHRLPIAYQTILSPVRAAYYFLGKEYYISLYHRLDALISIAYFETNYGGQLIWSLATASTSSIFAALVIWQLSKSSVSN